MTQVSGDADKQRRDASGGTAAPPAQLESQVIQSELKASDLDMARVVEDLVMVMIDKGLLMMTDLPRAAQEKLRARDDLRSRLGDLGGIVGDSEDLLLP